MYMKKSIHLRLLSMLLIGVVAGCGDQVPRIPPQVWQDLEIVVETRPVIVRPGMNEFLVIATQHGGLPGHDMVVSLRMTPAHGWQQAIQDGHSGVFRKAILVNPGQHQVQVQLRRKDQLGELVFALIHD